MNLYSDIEIKNIEAVVMSRIANRRLLRARLAAGFHGLLILGTFLAFVPAFEYTAARAVESGFSQYLSLLASDWSNLTGSWSAFIFSLAESAPIIGGIMTLGLLTIFVYSVRKIYGEVGVLRNERHYQAAI